jgi:hypothetical protein
MEETPMETIRHRVGITAPRQHVLDQLTTIPGLASWWTRDTAGDPTEGGTVGFTFGDEYRHVDMQVVRTTDSCVEWVCTAGPDEWVGNPFTFELTENGDETVVHFTNAWREPVEFMGHCTTKWGYFLLGLKASLEGGKATPFPGELQISSWG